MALVNTEKAARQFEAFSGLPMLRQLGLMAGLAASVALGVWVVNWSQSPSFVPLYGGLSSQDAADVVQILQQSGTEYEVDGSTISVPAELVHETRLKLASEGVPRAEKEGGFELLDQEQPFGTSSFMEKARYNRALEGELSQSISTLSSVQTARVHLAIPKRSAFARRGDSASASVLVNLFPGRVLTEDQVAGIVHLISSSVPDMPAEMVSVVDQQGRLLTSSKKDSHLAASSEQFRFIREVETNYSQRIVELLSPMVGPDRVSAQVSVEMDFTHAEKTSEQFQPIRNGIRSEQMVEESSSGSNSGGGIAGALSNAPPTADASPPEEGGGEQSQQASSTKNTTRNYELNKVISHVRESPGAIKRLSVAVVVDYIDQRGSDGKLTRTPLSDQEINRIEALVRDAVGFSELRGDSINVVNAPFRQDQIEFELDDNAPPKTAVEEILDNPRYMGWGKQLAGILAILVLIFGVLRPVLRSLATIQPANAKPALAVSGGDNNSQITTLPDRGMDEDQVSLSASQLQLPNQVDRNNYEQQLTMARSVVKEDPKRVAQVVKGWLDS